MIDSLWEGGSSLAGPWLSEMGPSRLSLTSAQEQMIDRGEPAVLFIYETKIQIMLAALRSDLFIQLEIS